MSILSRDAIKKIFSDPKIYIGEYLSPHIDGWLDACWLQGELIPVTDISGLSDYLGGTLPPVAISATATATYTIPAGYAIKKMYAKITGDTTIIQVGSIEGGDDYVLATDLLDGVTSKVSFAVLADVDTIVYFTIPQNTSPDKTTNLFIYIEKMIL